MCRARQLWSRAKHYITHDLREILAPTSLPNPPGYTPPPRIPLATWLEILPRAFREYLDTWDQEKLRAKLKEKHGKDPFDQEMQATKQELKSLVEEFGEAARGGASAMKPFLQNLWNTRAGAYRDAVQQFISGYKEGFQEANKPDIPPEVAQEMEASNEGQHQQPPEAGAAQPPTHQRSPPQQQGAGS